MITCAIYAKDNNLLELEGWKRFKSIARRQKKFVRMAKQAYLRSFRSAPKYKYGYEVAKDWDDAICLDKKAGNLKWQNAVEIELGQIDDYVTFRWLDFVLMSKVLEGYIIINLTKFNLHCILPFEVTRFLVKTDSIILLNIDLLPTDLFATAISSCFQ